MALGVKAGFVLIAVSTAWDYFRHLERSSLDVAAMFSAMAQAILFLGWSQPAHLELYILGLGFLVVKEYFLSRLLQRLRPLPRAAELGALAGLAVSLGTVFWVASAAPDQPQRHPALLIPLAAVLLVEGLAAAAFVRGARGTFGMNARRLRERCLEAGCLDYMTKPINTKELAPAVSVWLCGRERGV